MVEACEGRYTYGSEFVEIRMRIEKVFDGSEMNYEVINASSDRLSEKFKEVLREDWDIDVDEYTALVVIEDSVIEGC